MHLINLIKLKTKLLRRVLATCTGEDIFFLKRTTISNNAPNFWDQNASNLSRPHKSFLKSVRVLTELWENYSKPTILLVRHRTERFYGRVTFALCTVTCPFIRSAAFSAIITTPALMAPETISGMTEASTTRRPSTPITLFNINNHWWTSWQYSIDETWDTKDTCPFLLNVMAIFQRKNAPVILNTWPCEEDWVCSVLLECKTDWFT